MLPLVYKPSDQKLISPISFTKFLTPQAPWPDNQHILKARKVYKAKPI